jgi:hypothetical protein
MTSTGQFTPPGTTGTQLLDQAITDFADAAALLPASWDDANRGRVTRMELMACLENLLCSGLRLQTLRPTIPLQPAHLIIFQAWISCQIR